MSGFDWLSECLDNLGYSMKMIQYRREMNRKLDQMYNCQPYSSEIITTGGKADGTALYCESDIDRLLVVKGATCFETVKKESNSLIFQLEYTGCSAGYCRVKFIGGLDIERFEFLRGYLDKETEHLRSNVSFGLEHKHIIDVNGDFVEKRDKRGPSTRYSNDFIEYDYVRGILCYCPSLIERWVKCHTQAGRWPDERLIEAVSKLEAHVVPVADKSSKLPSFEWRICFTKAEMLLMESLTEKETKLYVILKMITKSVLKPICSEMTSYIIKNVIFWIKEDKPLDYFQKQNLLENLKETLKYFKNCIKMKRLESYMIPGRNLFDGRITDEEQMKLLDMIEQLLNENNRMFDRVEKIKQGSRKMEISHQFFQEQSAVRDEIESLVYRKNIIFRETELHDTTRPIEEFQAALKNNEQYKCLTLRLYSLVLPDNKEKPDSEVNLEQLFKLRLRQMLS